jgi:hypothetical protein
MFNPRIALVSSAALVCAALVACQASVGEEVRITGESEPAATSSDPSAPSQAAQPSQAHSDPVLVPTPPEPSGGAASAQAPASADASVDAMSDAGADVAPKPTYSCVAPTMWPNAPALACTPRDHTPVAGTFSPGGYYLSKWWTSTEWVCKDTTRSGTMYIELIDGITYLRWNLPNRVPGHGTFRLTPDPEAATVVREELCSKIGPSAETLSYSASSTEIVLTNGSIQETWTRIPKTLDPKFPIDPITK